MLVHQSGKLQLFVLRAEEGSTEFLHLWLWGVGLVVGIRYFVQLGGAVAAEGVLTVGLRSISPLLSLLLPLPFTLFDLGFHVPISSLF